MASIKRILEKTWLAAFVVLALAFVAYFFRNDRDKILEILRADLRLLGLAIVAQLLYFLAVVATWQKALSSTTRRSVDFVEGASQILLLNFGKYIPGKVWGIAARGARLGQLGYRLEEIGGVSYVEQSLLVACGFWLAFLTASLVYGEPVYVLLLLLTTLAIALFRHGNHVAAKIAGRFQKAVPIEALLDIRISARQLLALVSGYMSIWLLLTLTFVLFCSSLVDIQLTMVNVSKLLLTLTAGYLAGFIALFAPGGVGVREGVGAALLATIVTLEEAILIMLLFRVWAVCWELIGGLAVITFKFFRKRAESSG